MLAESVALLPSLALLVAAGLGLQLLLPAPLERSPATRAGYAFLLGVAWTGMVSWAAGYALGAPVGAGLFAAAALVAAGGGVLACARRRGGLGGLGLGRRRARGWPALAPAVLVLACATVALLADAATAPVTDFDGRMTWGTTAKYLLADRSVLPQALRDPDAYVIHPRYPILMPLSQAAVAALGGVGIESTAIRPLYVLFLPALFAVVAPAARRAGGPVGAGLVLALVFSAPMLLWEKEGGAIGTYSDLPLAALLAGGFAVLTHPRARLQPWRALPAGLLLAAAAGAKNEGLLLAVAVAGGAAAIAAFAARRRRRRVGREARAAIGAGLLVAAALAMIVAWRSEIPNRNDEAYFESFSARTALAGVVERGPALARLLAVETFDAGNWGALFWIAPALLVAGWRGLRGAAVGLALLVIGFELTLALGAYAVVEDLTIVPVTWNRFVIQVLAPLAVVLAAAAGGAFKELRRSRPPASA